MPRKTEIQVRRDTAANWTSANPILGAGEPGWESDTDKLKFGDGSTAWNSLAYFGGAGSVTSVFGRTGAVVAGAADYLAVESGGLSGATSATRYVGGTASGHPVSGTFATGDFVIDQSGSLWICITAGTPGTWVALGSASGNIPSGGATGQVVGYGGTSGTGAWEYPPGFEISYTEITSPVGVSGTTSATATTVLAPGAIAFDGTTVLVTVFSPEIVCTTASLTGTFVVSLFEGSTEIGQLGIVRSNNTTGTNFEPFTGHYRFTPSAGSHTYAVACYVSSTTGSPKFSAGPGGTNAQLPAFIRFEKV